MKDSIGSLLVGALIVSGFVGVHFTIPQGYHATPVDLWCGCMCGMIGLLVVIWVCAMIWLMVIEPLWKKIRSWFKGLTR